MNPLANELNFIIEKANPHIMEMLSDIGKKLFFPKGILSQSGEAKLKAYDLNATIGIAKEKGNVMCFSSVMSMIDGILPETSLTYAPSFGVSDLRDTWKEAQKQKNPSLADKKFSLPVVANGITHAISIFSDVWVNSEDVVILPDMMWGNYNMIFDVRKGAEISTYPIFNKEGGYNTDAFEKAVRAEAKKRDKIIVLLNFPHNPTGYSISKKEADVVVQILKDVADSGTNVIVVSDDAYFGLFYEEETLKESLFAKLVNTSDRLLAVKLDGATKENFVWGLRVGFITYGIKTSGDSQLLYEALEKKTAGCIRGNISNASHLSQSIVLNSMKSADYSVEKQEKYEILKQRAKKVKQVAYDPKYNDGWDVYPFNSGYFMCIKLKGVDAEVLRCHLLEKYGVGLIALGTNNLRVAFSCLEADHVEKLFDIVYQGIKDLR